MRRPQSPASLTAASKIGQRAKLSRAEKNLKIRETLFDAAAKVVGSEGYSNAMIATITTQAGLAQGTFYNYFESRQDLLDQLLPTLGREMLDFIHGEAADAASALEREERSFRAFFSFLIKRPEFFRILYEAEVFAPSAYQRHMETVASRYVRVLERALKSGQLRVTNPRELDAVAYMLMGVRHYLCLRFTRRDGEIINLPEWVVRTYMSVITAGVYLPPDDRTA